MRCDQDLHAAGMDHSESFALIQLDIGAPECLPCYFNYFAILLSFLERISCSWSRCVQTIFLPVVGLVDVEELKPGAIIGVNKDSYLVLEKLPEEYDSRIKVYSSTLLQAASLAWAPVHVSETCRPRGLRCCFASRRRRWKLTRSRRRVTRMLAAWRSRCRR